MTTSPLISPTDLAAALAAGRTVVLDIRSSVDGGGRAAFEAAHIPGARHTDYVRDGWRMQRGAAAGALPDEDALAALLGRLGLNLSDLAVVAPAGVSASDFAAAARVYWTLKVAGHSPVALLDGGTAAWIADGRPTESGPGRPFDTTKYAVDLDLSHRATLDEVAGALGGGTALIDSRGERAFVGDEKSPQAARAGRLPGAMLIEGAKAYDPAANRLRARPELDRLFAPAGDGEAIAYCNTGQAAATDWFVLSEVMGRRGVRLYDGSMSEWSGDPSRPVETGPT